MKTLFGVVFDMDGVLVHSNPAHKKAIKIFCDKHDRHVSEEFLLNKLYGRTNKEWIPEVFGELNDERLKELADEKESLFRKLFDPKTGKVNGIIDFLNHLKEQEIKMVVATSAPPKNADYILSELQIEDLFDAVLTSRDVTKGKPHPEVYQKAAASINFDPKNCIVFEDSVAGTQAGINAGSKTVGVATTHTPAELDQCDLVIEDFSNLTVKQLIELFPEKELDPEA